jgi:hypothetical protein
MMIAVHLHPPMDREPDHVISGLSILKWWDQETIVGGSVLAEYGTVLNLIRHEPGNEGLKRDLAEAESFTMASLTQVS